MSKPNSERFDIDLEASNAFTLKGEEENQMEMPTRIEIETNKKNQRATNSHRSIKINNLTNYTFGICESKFNEEDSADINDNNIDIIGTFKKTKNNIIPKERKCESIVKIKFTKMKKSNIIKAPVKPNTKSNNIGQNNIKLCDKEIEKLLESSSINKDEVSEENKMELDLLENKEDNKEKRIKQKEKEFKMEEGVHEELENYSSENEFDKKEREDLDVNHIVEEEINVNKFNSSDMIIEPERNDIFTHEKEEDAILNSQKDENNMINKISKMTLENEPFKEEKENDIIIEINKENFEENIQENALNYNCEENKEEKEDYIREKEANEIINDIISMVEENEKMKNEDVNILDKKNVQNEENKESKENKENSEKKEDNTQKQFNPNEEYNYKNDNEKKSFNERKNEEQIDEKNKKEYNNGRDEKEDNLFNKEKQNNINNKMEEDNKKEEKNVENKIKQEKEKEIQTENEKKIKKENEESNGKANANIFENMNNIFNSDFFKLITQQMKKEIYQEILTKTNINSQEPSNSKEKQIQEKDSNNNFLGKKRSKTPPKEINENDTNKKKVTEKEKGEKKENKENKKEKSKITNEEEKEKEKNNGEPSLYHSIENFIFNYLYDKVMKESLSNDNELEKQLNILIAEKGYSCVKSSLSKIKNEKDKKENENKHAKNKNEPNEFHYQFKNNFYHRYKSLKINDGFQSYICCDNDCKAYAKLNITERKFEIIQAHTIPSTEHINFNEDNPVKFMKSRKLDEVHIKKNDYNNKYHLEWFK